MTMPSVQSSDGPINMRAHPGNHQPSSGEARELEEPAAIQIDTTAKRADQTHAQLGIASYFQQPERDAQYYTPGVIDRPHLMTIQPTNILGRLRATAEV